MALERPVLRRALLHLLLLLLTVLLLLAGSAEARRRRRPEKRIQSRETNLFNFMRILVLRLVYGIASSFGFQEAMANFMGGIFVPPGVNDDYDDYGFDADDF